MSSEKNPETEFVITGAENWKPDRVTWIMGNLILQKSDGSEYWALHDDVIDAVLNAFPGLFEKVK